jgi:hypothetical protein
MQSSSVGSTVRVGNHRLTPEEAAAGVPERLPFVDADGAPTDPDTVALGLLAPTGVRRTFGYPAPAPGDSGGLVQQETGRFYVDWTPAEDEDGVWAWSLVGAMGAGVSPGSSLADQDVFYAKRPVVPPGAPAVGDA